MTAQKTRIPISHFRFGDEVGDNKSHLQHHIQLRMMAKINIGMSNTEISKQPKKKMKRRGTYRKMARGDLISYIGYTEK